MSIPFITVSNGKFQLNPQAKEHFLTTECSIPIGVISVLGKYRTGKSFLLNNVVIASGEQTFKVGPTVNSCTKGIWIAKELVKPLNSQTAKIVVLDVEGFGIVDQAKTDSRIFLFPLLLSSYLIYNSVGNITEEALRTLGLIVGLARDIQLKSQKQETCSYFPAFHWILRDFTLQLEDSFGNKMSTNQYLEKALEQQKGISESIEQKNRVRRNFKEFFKERDCSTLLKPTNSDQDTDTARQFRPEFLQQAQKLRRKILSNIQPKHFGKSFMTVRTFFELAETFVEILNQGGVPNVQSVWNSVYVSREKEIILQIQQAVVRKFEEGEIINERENVAQRIKESFQKQFKIQSLCPDTPPSEISRLLNETIVKVTEFAQDIIKEKNQRQAQQQILSVFNQIQQKVNNCQFKSILEFKDHISRVKFENTILFSRLPLDKQSQIEAQLMLKCFQCISTKTEIQLQVIRSQKDSLEHQIQQQRYVMDSKDKQIRNLNIKITESEQSNWAMTNQLQKVRSQLIRKDQQCISLKHLNNSQQQMLSSFQRQLKLNDNTQYQQIVKEITETQQQLLSTIDSRDKLSLELSKTKEECIRLSGDLARAAIDIDKMKDTVQRLNAEKVERENRIAETQRRIVQHIETEEIRIRDIIKAGEIREKEKDHIIEKLQRILRESKARKSQESNSRSSCHSSMLRMKEQLHDRCNQKEILTKQIEMLKKQLETRNQQVMTLRKQQISSLTKSNDKVKSSLMNIQLTQKGFEIKSFVSPTHKRDKETQKKYLQNQLTVQAQLITQNQKLISNLIARQKNYQHQITSLRQSINRLQEKITIVGKFYCLRCCKSFEERLADHTCLKVFKPQRSVLKDTEDWLNSSGSVILSVPVYYVNQVDGKTSTVYQIELRTPSDQKWTVKRKYKDICEIKKQLADLFPNVKQAKLYKSTKHDQKRMFVQDFLRDCLRIPEYRNNDLFKRFLCDPDYSSESQMSRVASLDSKQIENIVQQSCRRLTTDKSARLSSGMPNAFDRMPKTTKSKRQPLQLLEGFELHL